MEIQQDISARRNQNLVGTKQTVLIDTWQPDQGYYIGRTYRDAPEIDNDVIVRSDTFEPQLIGNFFDVKIDDASEYELYANLFVSGNKKKMGKKI
jgi:ribosomal protein S12 methylthiotransferase